MCAAPVRTQPVPPPRRAYSPCGLDAMERSGQPLLRPAVLRGIEGPELRCSTAVTSLAKLRSTAPHSAAPLLCAASAVPALSGHPWPSPLSAALKPDPARLLPRVCLHPLMRVQPVYPAGTQRARCSRTPCAPAAALSGCSPHPRLARIVCALNNDRGARSRGFRRPSDITRSYAQASCLWRRCARRPAARKPRARVTRRYVKWPPAHPCTCWGAALPARHCLKRPARAALRAPRLRAVHGAPLRRRLSRLRVG